MFSTIITIYNPPNSLKILILDMVKKMARPNKYIQAKLVLVGDMGTGKTSLVLRFVKGQFFDHQESTIGAAFFTQAISVNEATVKFDIWDTAGQERYHSLAPMYYRGSAAALIVYDLSNMMPVGVRAESRKPHVAAFSMLKNYKNKARNPMLVMALVANKSDLESKREVTTEEAEKYSDENGMFYIETSAKHSLNINELFYEIGVRLEQACPEPPAAGVSLQNDTETKRISCC